MVYNRILRSTGVYANAAMSSGGDKVEFPNGSNFAFTIFDDADNSSVVTSRPVYDFLAELGLRTTKSVWIYPPRGRFSGQALGDPECLEMIHNLRNQGFEISLHGVGDGSFTRAEILQGIREYYSILGEHPRLHSNHSMNRDNLYWGSKRFVFPFNVAYQLASSGNRFDGEIPESPSFWGDAAKEHIEYVRNLTFNRLNLKDVDPKMPYYVRSKSMYSNKWFSSSDGHTVDEFRDLIRPSAVRTLIREGGVSIVYTHFASGFVDGTGKIDATWADRLRLLADSGGWFVPVGELLDYLAAQQGTDDPGYLYHLRTNTRWALDRVVKRLKYKR